MKPQKSDSVDEKTLTLPPPITAAQPRQNTSPPATRAPLDDLHARITIRAYELYLQRGCREGGSLEDWLDAEREIVDRDFPT